MRVSMTRRGGFLDLDQTVEVEAGELCVRDAGTSTRYRLEEAQERRIAELVRAALDLPEAPVTDSGDPPSDDLVTEVEVDHAGQFRQFILHSGDEAPPELGALISGLDDVARG